MLVITAETWPDGDASQAEKINESLVIARVAMSAGGDYASYVAVHIRDDQPIGAALVSKFHRLGGAFSLVGEVLDPAGEFLPLDDERVVQVVAAYRRGAVSHPDSTGLTRLPSSPGLVITDEMVAEAKDDDSTS